MCRPESVLFLLVLPALLTNYALLAMCGPHKRHLVHSSRVHLWSNSSSQNQTHSGPMSVSSHSIYSVFPYLASFDQQANVTHLSSLNLRSSSSPSLPSVISFAAKSPSSEQHQHPQWISTDQSSTLSQWGWPSSVHTSSFTSSSSSWPSSSASSAIPSTQQPNELIRTVPSEGSSSLGLSVSPQPVKPSSDASLEGVNASKPIQYPSYPDLTQITFVPIIFLLLYVLVMLSALVGNLLVCYTVLSNHKMQTVVNCYIVNLALCDFLIGVFVLPSKLLELLAPASWTLLSDSLCMAMFFLQTLVVFASVLTLVATCFERYFAIVHPLQSRMQQSRGRTIRILIAVWLLSTLASMPNFFSNGKAEHFELVSEYGTIQRMTCMANFNAKFRIVYFTILFVAFYLIPLLLIGFTSFCIARSLLRTSVLRRQGSLLRQEVNRRKVGKMILIVVLSFTVSWTPYFLVSITTQYQEENFMAKHDYYFTMLCINLFAFLHSSVNPLIYATMSTRFRKGFATILRLVLCCQRQTSSPSNDGPTSSRGSIVNVNVTVSHNKNGLDNIKLNAVQWRRSMPCAEDHQLAHSLFSVQMDLLNGKPNGTCKSRRSLT